MLQWPPSAQNAKGSVQLNHTRVRLVFVSLFPNLHTALLHLYPVRTRIPAAFRMVSLASRCSSKTSFRLWVSMKVRSISSSRWVDPRVRQTKRRAKRPVAKVRRFSREFLCPMLLYCWRHRRPSPNGSMCSRFVRVFRRVSLRG